MHCFPGLCQTEEELQAGLSRLSRESDEAEQSCFSCGSAAKGRTTLAVVEVRADASSPGPGKPPAAAPLWLCRAAPPAILRRTASLPASACGWRRVSMPLAQQCVLLGTSQSLSAAVLVQVGPSTSATRLASPDFGSLQVSPRRFGVAISRLASLDVVSRQVNSRGASIAVCTSMWSQPAVSRMPAGFELLAAPCAGEGAVQDQIVEDGRCGEISLADTSPGSHYLDKDSEVTGRACKSSLGETSPSSHSPDKSHCATEIEQDGWVSAPAQPSDWSLLPASRPLPRRRPLRRLLLGHGGGGVIVAVDVDAAAASTEETLTAQAKPLAKPLPKPRAAQAPAAEQAEQAPAARAPEKAVAAAPETAAAALAALRQRRRIQRRTSAPARGSRAVAAVAGGGHGVAATAAWRHEQRRMDGRSTTRGPFPMPSSLAAPRLGEVPRNFRGSLCVPTPSSGSVALAAAQRRED